MAVTVKHPLAELIDQVKAANNWSDPILVSRARAAGFELTTQNISRYRNEIPLVSIKAEIIRALSAALGVSVQQVGLAGLASMGLAVHDLAAASPEQAIRTDPSLSESNKASLLHLLEELRRLQSEQGPDEVAQRRRERAKTEEAAEQWPAPNPVELERGPHVNGDDLIDEHQAPEPDRRLAARRGESEEKRRRRLEVAPEDIPDPEGPEGGA